MADPGGNFGGEGGAPGSRGGGPTGGRGGQPEGSVEATAPEGLAAGQLGRADRSALAMGFAPTETRYDPTLSGIYGLPMPAPTYPTWGPRVAGLFERALFGSALNAMIPSARFVPGLGHLVGLGLEKLGIRQEAPTFANRFGTVGEGQARAMAAASGGFRGGAGFEGGAAPVSATPAQLPAAALALQLAQRDPSHVLAAVPSAQLPAAQMALKELEMRLRLFRHLLTQRMPAAPEGLNA